MTNKLVNALLDCANIKTTIKFNYTIDVYVVLVVELQNIIFIYVCVKLLQVIISCGYTRCWSGPSP